MYKESIMGKCFEYSEGSAVKFLVLMKKLQRHRVQLQRDRIEKQFIEIGLKSLSRL